MTLHVHYKIITKDFQIGKLVLTVTRNLSFKRTTVQKRLFTGFLHFFRPNIQGLFKDFPGPYPEGGGGGY